MALLQGCFSALGFLETKPEAALEAGDGGEPGIPPPPAWVLRKPSVSLPFNSSSQ